MSQTQQSSAPEPPGMFAPLKEQVFRRIWTASLLSNFGQLILGVGAAWEMTRQTNDPGMVALVQTAMMLPLMVVAAPAGAIADMFDKRKIAMAGLAISSVCGAILTVLAWMGLATPWVLLAFCVLIGTGVSIYSPAWQSSIGEQVGPKQLPAAIALGTISYNVARSFGPAIGGAVVLLAGAHAAFAMNAVFYLPLLFAFMAWRRLHLPSRLPPERIDRAIVSGARFVFHSAMIRKVLMRVFMFGLVGSTGTALAPLIAKDILGGNAATFGLLLGAGGAGAVVGALFVGKLHHGLGIEKATRLLMLIGGVSLMLVGVSRWLPLTCFGMFMVGGSNILSIALFNIAVQVGAPRWVTARALSLFSAALTGGIAIGALIGGLTAGATSVPFALIASGVGLCLIPLVMIAFPLPLQQQVAAVMAEMQADPEVRLDITLRSGPIVIAIEYLVEEDNARDFYAAMLRLQRVRLRNGGFNWSLSRDIADGQVWTERYQFPTWGDYLRTRDRYTTADLTVQADVDAFSIDGSPKAVRRMLERPFGSVRWHKDSPDTQQDSVGYMGPQLQ